MTKEEFKKLSKEKMIIAFNQLKDDYKELDKETNDFCDMWLHKDKIYNKIKMLEQYKKQLQISKNDKIYDGIDVIEYQIAILKDVLDKK